MRTFVNSVIREQSLKILQDPTVSAADKIRLMEVLKTTKRKFGHRRSRKSGTLPGSEPPIEISESLKALMESE